MVAEVETLRLETPRLVLRRFAAADTDVAVAHEREPRMRRWIRPIQPLEAVRAKVARFGDAWRGEDGEWLMVVVTTRTDATMLGSLALRIESGADGVVELGYAMHPDVQRRGYTFEAAARLLGWLLGDIGVRKIAARVASPNVASARLLEKLGLQREGTLREHCTLDGTLCDEYLYGLLARERAAPT